MVVFVTIWKLNIYDDDIIYYPDMIREAAMMRFQISKAFIYGEIWKSFCFVNDIFKYKFY